MSLNSDKWIKKLSVIPLNQNYSNKNYYSQINKMKANHKIIDNTIIGESIIASILNERNIPDDINEAYEQFAPNIAKDSNLHERYLHHLENGNINEEGINTSVEGFIGSIKGKLGEIRLVNDNLEELKNQFPMVDKFEMHPDPTHPEVDVYGYDTEGNAIVKIQSKIGDESYVNDVVNELGEDSERYFSLSEELKDIIETKHPEFSNRITDTFNPSDIDLENEIADGLDTLQGNFGVDIPDKLTDILPYVAEVFLGYKIIKEYLETSNEFKDSNISTKNQMIALRTASLLNRFGFVQIGAFLGASGLSGLGLWGSIPGAIGGGLLGGKVSSKLEPKLLELILNIFSIDDEDLFYYKNKKPIDKLAFEYTKSFKLLN